MNCPITNDILFTCLTVFMTAFGFGPCLCIIAVRVVWALLLLFECRASCIFEVGNSRFAFCPPRFVLVVQTSASCLGGYVKAQ